MNAALTDAGADLWQVTALHFCAGIVTRGAGDAAVCTEAAPVLRWALGKTRAALRAYFARKGWAVRHVQREA